MKNEEFPTEISAEIFLNHLYNPSTFIRSNNDGGYRTVKGQVEFGIKEYFAAGIKTKIIRDCIFEGNLFIHGLSTDEFFELGDNLTFINCVFKSRVSIKFCKLLDIPNVEYGDEKENIQFLNCEINAIEIENCILPFGVLFKKINQKNISIKSLNLQENRYLEGGITFHEVNFIKEVKIEKESLGGLGININNCHFKKSLKIKSTLSPEVSFSGINLIFEDNIEVYGGEIKQINFLGGIFKGEVKIIATPIESGVVIKGSIFEEKVLILGKDPECNKRAFQAPKKVWIQDNKFLNGLKFDSDFMVVDDFTLIFSEKSSGVMEFENSFFNEVKLVGNNFNNSVFFRDSTYQNVIFTNCFNRALVSFNNNSPNRSNAEYKEFVIDNSNLGNTEFYDFDFSIYPIVRVIDSRMDNIFAFGVEWFEEKNLQVDKEETSTLKILSQKREIYRQLKFAAEKQSDRITALMFKAREVDTHKQYLREKRGRKSENEGQKFLAKVKRFVIDKLETVKFASRIDKLKRRIEFLSDNVSIQLGKTNAHGQNWIYPLLWIIGITLPLYPFLMILSDSEITFAWDWSSEGWNLFWDKFGEHSHAIPQLFNPARRFSDLFGSTNSFLLHLLDSLHRIVLAFFIFQIVSAFRKFVK